VAFFRPAEGEATRGAKPEAAAKPSAAGLGT